MDPRAPTISSEGGQREVRWNPEPLIVDQDFTPNQVKPLFWHFSSRSVWAARRS